MTVHEASTTLKGSSGNHAPAGRTVALKLRHRAEPLTLRLGTYAITMIEDTVGHGIGKLFSPGRAGVASYLYTIWGGLMHRPPEEPWTLDAAGRLIDAHLDAGGNLAELAGPVNETIVAARLVDREMLEAIREQAGSDPLLASALAAADAPTPSPTTTAGG